MRTRISAVLLITCSLALVACSSSSKSSNDGRSDTTTTIAKNLAVQTPDGEVSLSLDGQLPPDWPTTFPVPGGATPAGSGSLENSGTDVMIAVYSTTESPADTYDFYKSNSSLTITSAKSAGVGSAYLGTIKLGGDYDGSSIVVEATGDKTNIVITLKGAATAATTTTT